MDWYPWMVGCDALCLVLISFFYSMMGQGGSGNVLLDVQVSTCIFIGKLLLASCPKLAAGNKNILRSE